MVSTLSDLRVWSRALATGALLKPAVWREAKNDANPFEFAQNYKGPWVLEVRPRGQRIRRIHRRPRQLRRLRSTSMYSPARRTAIVVVSTKQPNAVTPPPMFQALAMAVFGPDIGFGLTPAQALKPNSFGAGPAE